MIYIKSAEEIFKIKKAADLWKKVADLAESMIVIGCNGLKIAQAVEQAVVEGGGTCTFKNYQGFPGSICVSLNEVAIHGIPNRIHFRKNDKIGIDIGVTLDGAICDSGFSQLAAGSDDLEYQHLIDSTYQALWAGISKALNGNRVGDITAAIETYIQTNCPQYAIVKDFCGHGCGRMLHESPSIPNYGLVTGVGTKLVPGMVICIEPILTNQPTGDYQVDPQDKWSIKVKPGYQTAHWEHMILILEDHSVVLTARSNEIDSKIIKR